VFVVVVLIWALNVALPFEPLTFALAVTVPLGAGPATQTAEAVPVASVGWVVSNSQPVGAVQVSTAPTTGLPFCVVTITLRVFLFASPVERVVPPTAVTVKGGGTVTVAVDVPDNPLNVAVNVAVPAATAVTRPPDDTVATAGFDELQEDDVVTTLVVELLYVAVTVSC
jgi:hypothetical protein